MEQFASVRSQLIRHLHQQIGAINLLIAASALRRDLALVTRKARGFQHVPELEPRQPS